MSAPTLYVSEIFGPTVQGEGISLGRAAGFLRLAGCHVRCTWCDTRYSWDAAAPGPRSAALAVEQVCQQVLQILPPGSRPLLVITGGEPLAQREELVVAVTALRGAQKDLRAEVETSGTLHPGELAEQVDLFTVSPKLAHSGVEERVRLRWAALESFVVLGERAVFKFVVDSIRDLDEVQAICDRLGIEEPVIMPLGASVDDLRQRAVRLVEPIAARGWRLSPRLHIDLWGDTPGR